VGLWLGWGHYLDRRLTEPLEMSRGAGRVRRGGLVDRLYPATPAGAVAARTLRYWRRDPRYVAGIAGFLIGPVILMVAQLANPSGEQLIAVFAPTLLCWLVGSSLAQDLSYDGSAIWQHMVSGISGRDDRAGRMMSTLTVFTPLVVVLVAVAVVLSGQWRLLPVIIGLTVGLALTGLGVGSYVGVLWQWPAPPPGANPFQRGNSGSLPALLSFGATSLGTLVLSVPTIAVAVAAIWIRWLVWLVPPVGVGLGLVVLVLGVVFGGRLLDGRWPEVMAAVSEKAA